VADDASRPWRCFWAVPLPDELREQLASFVAAVRTQPGVDAAWRFTEPEGWHVTLAFLGAVEPEAVEPMVARVVTAVAGTRGFEVSSCGLGGFPRGNRARVMWYGVADERKELAQLAAAVHLASGIAGEQAFRAHVTLARSRDRHGTSLPATAMKMPQGRIPVDATLLYRSHLGRGPARYRVLARVPLAAASVVPSPRLSAAR
jgi:2'-5' RNA ligase